MNCSLYIYLRGNSMSLIMVPFDSLGICFPISAGFAEARDCYTLLKKPGLDAADMGSCCPVSNLPFISKVVERAVASHLKDYLVANNLLPRFQSAYRKEHSTETAILRVWSDCLKAAGRRHVTLLSLLHMSATLDCGDHQ